MSLSGILINKNGSIMDITKEGLQKLTEELHELKTTKRKELAQRLRSAIAMGDLSENFDYKDAKEQQGFLEGRIKELGHMIQDAHVSLKDANSNVIQLGSIVSLKSKEGTYSYTIAGATEADPVNGKLSIESPIGEALIGKKVGDTAEVKTPEGTTIYAITRIE